MKEFLKDYLKCREVFEIPTRLLEALLIDEERNELLSKLDMLYTDKSVDMFRDFFQEEQANRKELKQDYTPDEISQLIAKLAKKSQSVADICAGTGSLTVAFLGEHPECQYVRCEEFSAQPIPFLLTNLALRNVSGAVIHGDSLTRETFVEYKLEKGERFSSIIKTQTSKIDKFDTVISNPPYSLNWNPVDDERFKDYGLAPKSKADYAFVLHAFSLLNKQGELLEILPHGVLFRGAGEGKIRQKLLENGKISTIIGLPDKLFLNTSIPTAVLLLKKERETKEILFIDGSKEFEKGKRQNTLKIKRILETYQSRKSVERFANVSNFETIKDNDFNLNIPRYVDTYVPEELPPIDETLEEWLSVRKEIDEVETELLNMFNELVSSGSKKEAELDKSKILLTQIVHKKQRKEKAEQLSLFEDV